MKNISVEEVAQKKQTTGNFVLLDVREQAELAYARFTDERVIHLPLSRLASGGLDALPDEIRNRETEIVVFCHHGVRSIQVANWMKNMGWKQVFNMEGGINAYAHNVDPSVGSY